MWTCGFLFQMFTKSFHFFGELQYIPQVGIHVFKTFQKCIYIYIYALLDFDIQTSLSIIIILNL